MLFRLLILVIQLKKLTAKQKKEKKILNPNHDKYITSQEFKKLTTGNFTARLTQAKLATKADIADFAKKTNFDKKLEKPIKKLLQTKQNMQRQRMKGNQMSF